MKILLVDDDQVDRELVKRSLESNVEIVEAVNCEEGISKIDQQEFDCIIMDNMLPERTGISLVQTVRDKGIQIPIIIISGHGNELVAGDAFKAGANDYLPKDKINKETLMNILINMSQKFQNTTKVLMDNMAMLKDLGEQIDKRMEQQDK